MKMSDLAELAGVSKSTVSRALSGSERVTKETRERIQELAKKHNYRMNVNARNFRLKQTLTIGVLLPSNGRNDWLASDPFILEMLGSIADALEAKGGHELLLSKHSNNDPSWIVEFAKTRSVDGLIVVGQSLFHEELNKASQYHKAMVVWGTKIAGQEYITVGTDNYRGGKLATEHLLSQGRKKIAFLGDIRFPETRLRYKGYQDTLKNAGLDYRPAINSGPENNSDFSLHAMSNLLSLEPNFDSLVASSDILALSAIKAISNDGLAVPDDIAVVGYDNITISNYSNPTLSSISQDRIIGGQTLVDTLFELIETGESHNKILDTNIVIRESSDTLK